MIGGIGWSYSSPNQVLDVIAKFENNNWSLYGNLQKGRSWHGSISSGGKTMIIGGYTKSGS